MKAGADLHEPRPHILGGESRIVQRTADRVREESRADNGTVGIQLEKRILQVVGKRRELIGVSLDPRVLAELETPADCATQPAAVDHARVLLSSPAHLVK